MKRWRKKEEKGGLSSFKPPIHLTSFGVLEQLQKNMKD